MGFRKTRLCTHCETMGTYTSEDDFSRWKDSDRCPACAKELGEVDQGDRELTPHGISVSVNGVPVKVLRWEQVLVDVSNHDGQFVYLDTGRRIIEVELPEGEAM